MASDLNFSGTQLKIKGKSSSEGLSSNNLYRLSWHFIKPLHKFFSLGLYINMVDYILTQIHMPVKGNLFYYHYQAKSTLMCSLRLLRTAKNAFIRDPLCFKSTDLSIICNVSVYVSYNSRFILSRVIWVYLNFMVHLYI